VGTSGRRLERLASIVCVEVSLTSSVYSILIRTFKSLGLNRIKGTSTSRAALRAPFMWLQVCISNWNYCHGRPQSSSDCCRYDTLLCSGRISYDNAAYTSNWIHTFKQPFYNTEGWGSRYTVSWSAIAKLSRITKRHMNHRVPHVRAEAMKKYVVLQECLLQFAVPAQLVVADVNWVVARPSWLLPVSYTL
jgi:hypothetical protein